MLSINSNIPSLVAQENLNSSGSTLSQAITRLSSGKRINSAADDAAGLAVFTSIQTQILGLNQGVQNANNGVSLVQTAGTGLNQITASLQRIRQLAGEATGGTLTAANQAALQQEVAQQISEVNRIASQTQFNSINLLTGSAGVIQVQVGANVGQTVALDLSQGVSAASLGTGFVQAGDTLGSITGLNLNADGTEATTANGAIKQINVQSNGTGGFTFTDQNGNAISTAASSALFTTQTANGISALSLNTSGNSALDPANELTAISGAFSSTAAAGTVFGTISGINIDGATGKDAANGTANTVTSITAEADGKGGVKYVDQHNQALSSSAQAALFGASSTTIPATFVTAPTSAIGSTAAGPQPAGSVLASVNTLNQPTSVAQIDISTTQGANNAIESIDNALSTISGIQATLGALQNRFTAIAQSQQNESTDLSSAQSQIADADFAMETASLSKAQVLQQAGVSVLAQANSLPQQVLRLLPQ
ncbi:flagellin [Paraburkholderia rhizosphaerae]|uniref:Flagellin n=1 Tax=Paraburkholderia rhizosphaerae TaxID=480658 RepID=A0A4V3HE98_9BURK|nr:flagellin [Paraburkholderia rhizosphaerae]TDY45345.1 flagellin [Paraburkholderia rhizosphaerae]